MNSRIGRNVIAGISGSVFTALVGLVAVPFYLRFLGIEAYGLVGFSATTNALLQVMDLGIAPAVNREMARCSASGRMDEGRRLLHSFAALYWIIGLLLGALIFLVAPAISSHWLNASHLPAQRVTRAVRLIGLVIACRWPTSLYQNAIMGVQRITLSSWVAAAMNTVSIIGAVVVIVFFSATIEAFFAWQAAIALLHAVIMRMAAWRVIGRPAAGFDLDSVTRVWRFAAGMSGIGVTSLLLTQLDKVILSRMLSLRDFGYYSLAWTVSAGLYLLVTPFFNALFPRFTALVSHSEEEKLVALYRRSTEIFCALFLPMSMLAVVFARELLWVWTRNAELSSRAAPIVAIVILGTTLNGVMHLPYALQLAYGAVRLPLFIAASLCVLLVPLIFGLTSNYGAIGGASAWFVLNFLYLFYGTWLTHRSILKGLAFPWLLNDVGVPLLISVGTAVALRLCFRQMSHISAATVVLLPFIAFGFLLSLGVIVLALPRLRAWAVANYRTFFVEATLLG
jgi:O-antigen/teichoic acid export membrane protein